MCVLYTCMSLLMSLNTLERAQGLVAVACSDAVKDIEVLQTAHSPPEGPATKAPAASETNRTAEHMPHKAPHLLHMPTHSTP